ncbi:unnamed protein product [Rotaria magnacalcarata]|uniref:Uncharacterized protein n=3 Tax=Rotaria magnacalcarata TaxID=392030 RepID=A0A819VTC8_9BILA|nr:unnamed protein product [Rotaria magnacalcarata]CAF1534573.1 unnamed protein product [Rotaria magnacalcarata]CAF1934569.1 unnamed protein product [Rotaria magnacalcarata]CAF2024910.1 unnamed protein product [Rotaria magnacalcarata]CAF2153322.1 unnamed protein product [Rotaria magnacalcarata]
MPETVAIEAAVTPVHGLAYKVYKTRFYVLFVFSFLAFNQCIMWLTFSPIARNTEIYYNITDSTIDLLLNWGPIIFIPCLPLTSVLVNRPDGLRHCVILLAITDFLAALSRVIPSVIISASNPKFNKVALPFIHVGQILNAACGPLVMAPVSQLSCLWFAPHERTRATTVAIFANNFGATIGFVLSPFIVALPEHVPRLLYVHLGLAFVACVLALLYFPSKPPSAPSAAAELLVSNSTSTEHNHDWRKILVDIWKCLTTPAFLLLSLAGGLLNGTFGAWTSLYDIILQPENYTEAQAGWFGFGSSIAGIIGGLVLSTIADTRRFQHALKTFILISLIGCLCGIVWFELCVHSLFYDKHILSSTALTIGLSTALAGLFSGAATPLIYEALAEIMFPLPESLSASILVQWINIVSLVFLFVAPNRDKLVNFLVLVVGVGCIIMVVLTRFTYRRRDEDERQRVEKEQNQAAKEINTNHLVNDTINEQSYGTFD